MCTPAKAGVQSGRESGTSPHHDPLPQVESEQTVADLTADPEIAALLHFEPVPRKIAVAGGWTPDKQREFIARLAVRGSPNGACDEMGMHRTGVTKLYKSPFGASFRESWHGAVALATSRQAQRAPRVPISGSTVPPSLDHRFKDRTSNSDGPLPGQVLNEYGEWEDEDSYARRGEEAYPHGSTEKALLELEYIVDQLSDFYDPNEARQFVFSRQKLLQDCSPAELIKRGAIDEVLALVNQLRDGVFL